jgi:hypothetical protein
MLSQSFNCQSPIAFQRCQNRSSANDNCVTAQGAFVHETAKMARIEISPQGGRYQFREARIAHKVSAFTGVQLVWHTNQRG